jgi:hypothetical protein
MRLQAANASHASIILSHGTDAAFAPKWQRWAIAAVKTAIFPAFFLSYAASPRLFHRFMALFWDAHCGRLSLLIKDVDTNSAVDFAAHASSISYALNRSSRMT